MTACTGGDLVDETIRNEVSSFTLVFGFALFLGPALGHEKNTHELDLTQHHFQSRQVRCVKLIAAASGLEAFHTVLNLKTPGSSVQTMVVKKLPMVFHWSSSTSRDKLVAPFHRVKTKDNSVTEGHLGDESGDLPQVEFFASQRSSRHIEQARVSTSFQTTVLFEPPRGSIGVARQLHRAPE